MMLVANSFDLWQRDTFFSAAEEVQQSADRMESAYRTWVRARREESLSQHLEEFGRELQMALGTAKWQLEEFESAVRLSYMNNGDDLTITRHRQFVSAIQDQISLVETALKESLTVEGKKPFRWVVLDENECEDFALFLSGTPGTSQRIKEESLKLGVIAASSFDKYSTKENYSLCSEVCSKMPIQNQVKSADVAPTIGDANFSRDPQGSKLPMEADEISDQADRIASNRRAWSSPDRDPIEIVIDSDDNQNNLLIEATPKSKGFKPFFWRSRGERYSRMPSYTQMRMINWMKRQLRFRRSQRQQQLSPVFPVKSRRVILALILAIFLVGTLYSSQFQLTLYSFNLIKTLTLLDSSLCRPVSIERMVRIQMFPQ